MVKAAFSSSEKDTEGAGAPSKTPTKNTLTPGGGGSEVDYKIEIGNGL